MYFPSCINHCAKTSPFIVIYLITSFTLIGQDSRF
uniref:Uncharacterized protein n=1 Tax=Arundo donax TaxID=35708 RepID=A0A0A8ZQC1_ARUDO